MTNSKHNTSLIIIKVLLIGIIIAVLSYLFHPEVGQLSVMVDGQPIADPIVRFAAVPTFLMIIGCTVILTILLFLGIGVFVFLGTIALALLFCMVIAHYFWPVLAIIALIIILTSFNHTPKQLD
jgi:hypothetical protein